MRLIPNWRKAWKLHSVWLSTLCATAAGVWVALPDAQQQTILDALGIKSPAALVIVGFLAVVLVRLKAQPPKEPPQ